MRRALTARDAMIPVRPINEPRSGTSGSGASAINCCYPTLISF